VNRLRNFVTLKANYRQQTCTVNSLRCGEGGISRLQRVVEKALRGKCASDQPA
jgi:hypothetical protein